jgi:excisionase family DNA binding protein
MPVIESLIGVKDVARLTGMSARSVWTWIKSGRTPPIVRIGRAVRFHASQVDAWIRADCRPWSEIKEEGGHD